MSLAYVSTTIDAPIETVWSVVRDFHGMPSWVGRIRESVAEDGHGPAAVGSVRRLTLEPDGRQVQERLVSYDAPGHRYSYEFAGENPFPVRFYRGTVHLLPITEFTGTFVEWYGEFDADAALVESLCTRFTGLYREFLGDLRAHLDPAPH
ncbi:SRPBCC family protein [Streptosporangium sp. CA-115845]|uniref:SRPBCC family protein n=1 Tax=Streptosporangium sp. CA-115845 TaxID=3240071 RepID=UPI003D908C02